MQASRARPNPTVLLHDTQHQNRFHSNRQEIASIESCSATLRQFSCFLNQVNEAFQILIVQIIANFTEMRGDRLLQRPAEEDFEYAPQRYGPATSRECIGR